MPIQDIRSEIAGSVWQVVASVGDAVSSGDSILVLESMKMEIPVVVEEPGTLVELLVGKGDAVAEGQVVARVKCT